MAINTGVNVSKAVSYVVLAPKLGVNVTKAVAYAVLKSTNVTPPSWPAFTFADGVVGIAYSQTWDLAPAAPPTTYTLVAGALPDGLALSNLTGCQGRISGTPTVAAIFNFTLRASNAYGTADQAFTLTVVAAPVGGGATAHGWAY